MGFYINPKDEEKEEFLEREGERVVRPVLPSDGRYALICLVDNGMFTAAGVVYSQEELSAFNSPLDMRPKKWYNVLKTKLYDVVPGLKPTTFR